MGADGMRSVLNAAAIGVPLPLCSCGVVPVSITLGKKGASRSSVMSFLITTPESGVDSILVTWVLMGPWYALFRPIASVFTALLAGVFSIGLLVPSNSGTDAGDKSNLDEKEPTKGAKSKRARVEDNKNAIKSKVDAHGACSDHSCCHDGEASHGHAHDLEGDADYVGFRGIWIGFKFAILNAWHRILAWEPMHGWYKPAFYGLSENKKFKSALPAGEVSLGEIIRRVLRFGFVELTDDIIFPLLLGVVLSGVIVTVFPADLGHYGLGGGWKAYALMLLVGIPLYMCASASTPIAAALVLKGLSPGAALVFLLSGPATNITTITTLSSYFGRRFVCIYLSSIAFGAVVSGLLLDLVILAFGWELIPTLAKTESGWIHSIQLGAAIVLLVLAAWRFWKGAALAGARSLTSNIRAVLAWGAQSLELTAPASKGERRRGRRFLKWAFLLFLGLSIYLASGFFTVPPGNVAFGKLFGRVVWEQLPPGIHYLPPRPFVKVDIWPVKFPHRLTIGLATPPAAGPDSSAANSLAAVQEGSGAVSSATAGAAAWHLPGSSLEAKDPLSEFLAGDQNFVKILITIVYHITDPWSYYYQIENPERIISNAVQASAREFVAQNIVDDLLSRKRRLMEEFIMDDLHAHLMDVADMQVHESADAQSHEVDHLDHIHIESELGREIPSVGINIQSVSLIDIHPPEETIVAFRDVSSAMEDRHQSILNAEKVFTLMIPQAVGSARLEILRATAAAAGKGKVAAAVSESISLRASQVSPQRSLMEDVLWFQTVEKAMSGREKFVLPPGTSSKDLILWRSRGASQASGSKSHD